jgi:RNA polymerase sporulation-specific sigma factor
MEVPLGTYDEKRRDETGFEEERILLAKYLPLVRKITRPYYFIGGDNDDLVQEGMIGLLLAVRSFRMDTDVSFETYATKCIRNRVINGIKSSNRLKHRPLGDYISLSEDSLVSAVSGNPEEDFIQREKERELIETAKLRLSPLEWEVFQCFLQGQTYREISTLIHKPVKSVDNAITRIRWKLKEFRSAK